MSSIRCFKAYDLRGRIPEELNEDVAYRVGRGYAEFVDPARVVVGRDIRLSSPSLSDALCRGLTDSGVDVDEIGVCGTEGVYFATFDGGYDGGIMVTASHNPPDYNGMKFVREQSKPISADNGLKEIRACAEGGNFRAAGKRGARRSVEVTTAYIEHLLSYVDVRKLKPLEDRRERGQRRGRTRPGPLGAALALRAHQDPSRSRRAFPERRPESRCSRRTARPPSRRSGPAARISGSPGTGTSTAASSSMSTASSSRAITSSDFSPPRCCAEPAGSPAARTRIVHDPRLTWNTQEIVRGLGGETVLSKSGHAFIKQRMREVDAVYGGEMSAHHYFRRFAYCDSGMIPWLLIAQIISESARPMSRLVGERIARFPVSGELNYRVPDAPAAIAAVESRYARAGPLERPHRRGVVRIRRLALQSALLEYRAAAAPQRRGAGLGEISCARGRRRSSTC